MKQIYIVIEGGCVRYVSTDSPEVIKYVGVTVIDLDDLAESGQPLANVLDLADKAVHIW